MRPEERDAAYLWDIVDAAESVAEFIRDMTIASYLSDRKVRYAVERAIEIIGEAAKRVSKGFKASHPEIPWTGIVAQRNVIAHEYGEIQHERIWELITARLPELVRRLKPLIPQPPAS